MYEKLEMVFVNIVELIIESIPFDYTRTAEFVWVKWKVTSSDSP